MKDKFMKKTVVALAVLGAMACAAHAQSSVTLYGLVDANVGKTTNKNKIVGVSSSSASTGTSLNSGGLNGSRWGLRGSEDLGGGLKATFVLEQGFSVDTGVATATAATPAGFNRTSKVGLSGGFGSIEMGRQYTQLFLLMDGFDAQASSSFGATTNTIFNPTTALNGATAGTYTSLAPAVRWDNSLVYTTPNMGGFTAAAQYAFGENGTATASAGRSIGLSAGYAAGPIAVKGVYESVKTAGPTATTAKSTGLGVSYDFTVVKLLAQFINQKDGLVNGVEDHGYVLGAVVPVASVGSVHVGFGRDKAEATVTGVDFGKAASASVEYRHDMSKRTTLYAGLTNVKFTRFATTTAPESSLQTRLYGVGMRHKF